MIHPSAVISSRANLAADVEVGPYSIIGPEVEIDTGTVIGPHVVIQGPSMIGKNNRIFQFASIGEAPQDKKFQGESTKLKIGDENILREYCTIHRGTAQDCGETTLGDRNLLMAYTHVAHDCVVGNDVVMANAASLAGHVHLDDHVTLGGFTLVHQFCHIGSYVFSAMGSHINKDIPPYAIVAGQPVRFRGVNQIGLERKGFQSGTIRAIRQAYKILYKSDERLEAAIARIASLVRETPQLQILLDFLRRPRRSLLR